MNSGDTVGILVPALLTAGWIRKLKGYKELNMNSLAHERIKTYSASKKCTKKYYVKFGNK